MISNTMDTGSITLHVMLKPRRSRTQSVEVLGQMVAGLVVMCMEQAAVHQHQLLDDRLWWTLARTHPGVALLESKWVDVR